MSDQRYSLINPAHSLVYSDDEPIVELMVLDGNVQIGRSFTLTARDIKNIVSKLAWQAPMTKDLPAHKYAYEIGLMDWMNKLETRM